MCAIAGIYNFHLVESGDTEVTKKMCASMTHRGPDATRVKSFGRASFGACRLAIIDVASGYQPIANEAETIWVVLNGEIYNYRQLKAFLEKQGHRFRTSCDTEVLVHMYEEFGEQALEYLDGIFCFAVWDSEKDLVFIARDRLGVKPLYYAEQSDRLIFSSEMKGLLTTPYITPSLDMQSLNEYLSFEYVPTPNTILKGIKRLKPGHFLIAKRGGVTLHQWWDLNLSQSESRPPVHWRDYSGQLENILSEVVRDELISDVPIGVFLSGGIDSSTIAAMAVRHHRDVDTFSIGFQEKSFDESNYARLASRHLGTRHHEMIFTGADAKKEVPEILSTVDEPFGDSSYVPTFILSRMASKKIKVALGGDGGDEVLAGYPTLIGHRLIEQYAKYVPWIIRARLMTKFTEYLSVSFDNLSRDFRIKRFLAGRGIPDEIRHHKWLGSFYEETKLKLLQDWTHPIIIGNTYNEVSELAHMSRLSRLLNQLMYLDAKFYLEGDILWKVDRASMANSLEVRVPFLNKRVVSFLSQVPIDLKLKRYTSKYLLKKTVSALLPKQIVNRKKKGFNIPVARWINNELKEFVDDMLAPSMLKQHALFDARYVEKLLREHRSQQKDHRKLIWTLLSFQVWQHNYL